MCARSSPTGLLARNKAQLTNRSSSRAKMATNGRGRNQVEELADAEASFKNPGSRNEKGQKVTDRRETTHRHCRTGTGTHHRVERPELNCCLINTDCPCFPSMYLPYD